MEKLRCSGCKASLTPQDAGVQFITCEYCRATMKNPKFREAPVNHHQNVNQGPSQHIQQPRNNQQSNNDAEILTSLLTSIPSMTGHRRRRRFGRRRGCGCGCGCLTTVIFILIGISLLRFIIGVGFDEIIYWIERLIN